MEVLGIWFYFTMFVVMIGFTGMTLIALRDGQFESHDEGEE